MKESRREALELHAMEMEMAFMFGESQYSRSKKRLDEGSTDPMDVFNVLKGAGDEHYRNQTLLLFPDATSPLTAILNKLSKP